MLYLLQQQNKEGENKMRVVYETENYKRMVLYESNATINVLLYKQLKESN